jgi:hypothetical protein
MSASRESPVLALKVCTFSLLSNALSILILLTINLSSLNLLLETLSSCNIRAYNKRDTINKHDNKNSAKDNNPNNSTFISRTC